MMKPTLRKKSHVQQDIVKMKILKQLFKTNDEKLDGKTFYDRLFECSGNTGLNLTEILILLYPYIEYSDKFYNNTRGDNYGIDNGLNLICITNFRIVENMFGNGHVVNGNTSNVNTTTNTFSAKFKPNAILMKYQQMQLMEKLKPLEIQTEFYNDLLKSPILDILPNSKNKITMIYNEMTEGTPKTRRALIEIV